MGTLSIEERLTALEEEVERLKRPRKESNTDLPWWEKVRGTFKDVPAFEEAMRNGREYREAQRSDEAMDADE